MREKEKISNEENRLEEEAKIEKREGDSSSHLVLERAFFSDRECPR